MVKDLRLEVKVRNNLILKKMEERGIDTVAELARQMGSLSHQGSLGRIINFKQPACQENGKWISTAIAISDFFECLPEDLFSNDTRYLKLQKNKTSIEADFGEVQRMLAEQKQGLSIEHHVQASELKDKLYELIYERLNERERFVILCRFGMDNFPQSTLQEIGDCLDLGQESIRQIEARAVRKLRRNWHDSIKLLIGMGAFDSDVLESL